VPSKFIVVVALSDEFATKRPEIVAMPAHGGFGQTLVQQVQQERREQRDDLLANGNVGRLDVPGPWPVVQIRAGLVKSLRVMRLDNGCAPPVPI